MFNLFTEWKKCKNIFQKPKLQCYFGSWYKDPCLPVWRKPKEIVLFKKNTMQVVNSHWVKINDTYIRIVHKLPKNIKCYDLIFNSQARRRLRKYHLGWIKPVLKLPMWLTFYFFSNDIIWKTKWDEIRYEFPPSVTFVFFGLSFSVWAKSPIKEQFHDAYFESMLTYNCRYKDEPLEKFITDMGFYNSWCTAYPFVKKEYLNEQHHELWYKVADKIITSNRQY